MTDKLYHECHDLIRQGRAVLQELQEWGFESVTVTAFEPTEPAAASAGKKTATAVSAPETLAELEAGLQGCQLCPLCQERKNIVFGQGNPQADLVLVGEAPGREEDERGYPFVGEAGRLLEKILFAMNLQREDVYICNVIKCRPPHNRDPEAGEIATCEQFLQRQLEIIKPRLVITLGRFAAHTLLQTAEPISRLRGHWKEYRGIAVMPTFHPAYLLRNPAGKREVWQDMKQVMQRLQG
ncbi:uracil-DNA glycosylase [Pelobacter seleniigenes]|uniref:uracil-DNA glycosylase n=1 Tax=Pelobacter seleniigenes TaxID=407188 RepID=UPI0004A734A9|nr:uracil-DNA glycosylase [Pelobacter seleniigenes]